MAPSCDFPQPSSAKLTDCQSSYGYSYNKNGCQKMLKLSPTQLNILRYIYMDSFTIEYTFALLSNALKARSIAALDPLCRDHDGGIFIPMVSSALVISSSMNMKDL